MIDRLLMSPPYRTSIQLENLRRIACVRWHCRRFMDVLAIQHGYLRFCCWFDGFSSNTRGRCWGWRLGWRWGLVVRLSDNTSSPFLGIGCCSCRHRVEFRSRCRLSSFIHKKENAEDYCYAHNDANSYAAFGSGA